jgi:hypothetical protein
MSHRRVVRTIVENPYLNILVGVIFLLSGIAEVVSEWKEIEELKLGVHHGAVLFAIMHILKTFPDFFESLEYIEKRNGAKENIE